MSIKSTYVSSGANRASTCSAITPSGAIAFGADRAIATWSPSSTDRNVGTLPGHQANVTALKSCGGAGASALISGDAEGSARYWKEADGEVSCKAAWSAHAGHSISAIASLMSDKVDGRFVTGASDGLVKIWWLAEGSAELQQEIDLKGQLPLDIAMALLPGSEVPVLILGLTERRIRIYTYANSTFTHSISLEGHEDWIRCLAIAPCPSAHGGSDLLLASGSQDNFIRLWRISAIADQTPTNPTHQSDNPLDMLDDFERKLAGEGGGSTQISTKAHVMAVEDRGVTKRFDVTLEALLVGHESGLTNAHWSPAQPGEQPHLLSTASDNSMILWTPSAGSSSVDGIWIPAHRFGAVGGRGLAFYGGLWAPDGKSVFASGWTGGWERWQQDNGGNWSPTTGITGHWNSVASIEWSPEGEYLMSQSTDQTTRIHAYHTASKKWAEIARPQIHGYDMTCGTWLGPYRFASGADEKLTRVFDAPEGFVQSLKSLAMEHADPGDVDRPKGATVPPLGLSNRALGRVPDQPEIPTQNAAQDSISMTFTELPTEEELATSTLWPEVEKVYGHGYEIACMASSPDHTLLATACEARTLEHAAVRLSSTTTWDSIGAPLSGHTLTVTRIAFHPGQKDGRILTVSRDRSWRVWAPDASGQYTCAAAQEKAHARMINDGCWWSDGSVTAGRDKCVKVWKSSVEGQWTEAATIKLDEGATAVDAVSYGGKEVLAVGTESGAITLYEIKTDTSGITLVELAQVAATARHVRAVHRIAFRPASGKRGLLEMASCSADRSVRVFIVDV